VSAAPANAYPVLWRDTQTGRAEEWCGRFVAPYRDVDALLRGDDWFDLVEARGIEQARRVMREGVTR
jgi:hypothetical protein